MLIAVPATEKQFVVAAFVAVVVQPDVLVAVVERLALAEFGAFVLFVEAVGPAAVVELAAVVAVVVVAELCLLQFHFATDSKRSVFVATGSMGSISVATGFLATARMDSVATDYPRYTTAHSELELLAAGRFATEFVVVVRFVAIVECSRNGHILVVVSAGASHKFSVLDSCCLPMVGMNYSKRLRRP